MDSEFYWLSDNSITLTPDELVFYDHLLVREVYPTAHLHKDDYLHIVVAIEGNPKEVYCAYGYTES